MNRIYLFLFALLAVGYSAKAADFKLNGQINGDWQTVDLDWVDDNPDEYGNPQKHYVGYFDQPDTEWNDAEMMVLRYKDGDNISTDKQYATFKTTDGQAYDAPHGWTMAPEGGDFNTGGKIKLKQGKRYKVDFYYKTKNDQANKNKCNATNDALNNHWLAIEEAGDVDIPASGDFYFYGDMNRWSSFDNASQRIKVFRAVDNDVPEADRHDYAEEVFEAPYPTYFSKEVLERDWKFKPVDAAHKWSDADISDNSDWLYLDFTNLYDGQGHRNRLCGQFKLINDGHHLGKNRLSYNAESNDVQNNTSSAESSYYNGALVANATTSASYAYDQGNRPNIVLEANYVKNAVLYFNPTTKQLLLKGDPCYNYVYYGIVGGSPVASDITSSVMNNDNQYNYFINTKGYNGTTGFTSGNGNPLSGKNYTWEEVTSQTQLNDANGAAYWVNGKINYKGLEFTKVLRRRIPSGATHRYPLQVTVGLQDKDTKYDNVRVLCDDIWFINTEKADVNVYFRYDDDEITKNLGWVGYNAFKEVIDENMVLTGHNYLYGGYRANKDADPSIHGGDYAMMQLVTFDANNNLDGRIAPENYGTWWASKTALPLEFSNNTYAIFAESRGGVYPAERAAADRNDLERVAVNGKDLFYVATTKTTPSILYSTLNGSYSIKKSTTEGNGLVQINAEMYDPETMSNDNPTLISDMAQVKYRFEIWKDGHLLRVSGKGEEDGKDGFKYDENGYSVKPFYNWIMNDGPTEDVDSSVFDGQFLGNPGYYFIVVKALYNGVVYTAQDTYALYE